jgi:Arc/MetJ-type ribon-helix-helix transcriptional regulator
MHYQFPADISQRLEACIAGGRFANEEEVLRKALDALEERELEKLERWQQGNAKSIEQSRQGLSKPLDDDAVLSRLRARLAAEGIAN